MDTDRSLSAGCRRPGWAPKRLGGATAPIDRRIQRALSLSQPGGVRVLEVREAGPARLAGVEEDDLIVELDGTPVTGIDTLQRLLDASRIDKLCVLRVVRRGRLLHPPPAPRERGRRRALAGIGERSENCGTVDTWTMCDR